MRLARRIPAARVRAASASASALRGHDLEILAGHAQGVVTATVQRSRSPSMAGGRGRRCRGCGCGAVEGIPGRAPARTGCDAACRGMVTGLDGARCSAACALLGRGFPNPAVRPTAGICRAKDLLLAAGSALGCPESPGRVPLVSSTIVDLSRRSRHCAATVAAHAHQPPLTGRSPGENAMVDSCCSHLRIRCETGRSNFWTLRDERGGLGKRGHGSRTAVHGQSRGDTSGPYSARVRDLSRPAFVRFWWSRSLQMTTSDMIRR